MYKFLFSISIVFVITFAGCNNKADLYKYENGGVVITFDDHYVQKWLMADSALQKYNWKASFCLTLHNRLTDDQIQGLKYLELQGHEIAGHGLQHLNAIEYIKTNSIDNYLQSEVDPMIELMNKSFHNVTSFAYPNGSRNKDLDNKLFTRFKILRSTTNNSNPPEEQDCFFTGSHLVMAWGIDQSYEHYSKELLIQLLNYTHENNLILILYAHRPTKEISIKYQVEISTLEYICNFVEENNMKFLRLKDLGNL
ncbi:MAG: polysaccharide deacetylase family protein [Bacteroidales bacterium]|nr:polysaccharide deacetylase family protein [Bacteroidales bacterium]